MTDLRRGISILDLIGRVPAGAQAMLPGDMSRVLEGFAVLDLHTVESETALVHQGTLRASVPSGSGPAASAVQALVEEALAGAGVSMPVHARGEQDAVLGAVETRIPAERYYAVDLGLVPVGREGQVPSAPSTSLLLGQVFAGTLDAPSVANRERTPRPEYRRVKIYASVPAGASLPEAAIGSTPLLGRYHEFRLHRLGNPGAPGAPDIHGTGVRLSGPAAVPALELLRGCMEAGTAALATACGARGGHGLDRAVAQLVDGRSREVRDLRRRLLAGCLGLPLDQLPDDAEVLVAAIRRLVEDGGRGRVTVQAFDVPDVPTGSVTVDAWKPDGSPGTGFDLLTRLAALLAGISTELELPPAP